MIARIKRFIRSNLSIVTLKMLEVELNLDYNELNSLSKSFRPAKYIKERRSAIAKEMLLANESISEISKKTGYSETYLVKNKYRFIK
jgi:AraC-like DNA-binding protein